jgi:energy-coupling factor transporter ATP-binding protein EcfA2
MKENTGNPYVGLRPFETGESLLFFGRNEQTSELLLRLHKNHFVAVVGSSGSGKSSLLKAGLIPALKAGYLVEDSDQWMIAIMKPGQSPLANLAASILAQIKPDFTENELDTLLEQMKDYGADAIIKLLQPIWAEKNINFFLLVDQFEEFFRFAGEIETTNENDEAIEFINIMLELSRQRALPVYVVITMRSDFIEECTRFHGLPEAMNQSQFLVPRINRRQLRQAIEGPAKLYGKEIEHSLTSHLLNVAGRTKDELPLLQHVLMRLWEFESAEGKFHKLTLENYHKIGGVKKALSNHADEAMQGMNADEQLLTEKIFKALSSTDESGRKLRRPKLLSSLASVTGGEAPQILKIINKFIEEKRNFLIINKSGNTDDVMIDISHESLMRVWVRMGQWVEEEAESAKIYARICENALLWDQGNAGLWRDPDLQIALDWRKKNEPNANWAEQYNTNFSLAIKFLGESLGEKKRMFAEKNRRRRNLIILTFLVLAIVSSLAIWANNQRKKAEISARQAKIKEVEAKKAQKTSDSLVVISNAFAKEMEIKNIELQLANDKTQTAKQRADLMARKEALSKNLAEDKTRELLKTNKEILALNLANASYKAKVNGFSDNAIKPLLALQAYKFYKELGKDPNIPEIYSALFSAYRFLQKTNEYAMEQHPETVTSIAFSPDGTNIASGDDAGNLLTNSADYPQANIVKFKKLNAAIKCICYNRYGDQIVAGTNDGTLAVFNTNNPKDIKQYSISKNNTIKGVIWHGDQIITICTDKVLRIHNSKNPKENQHLSLPAKPFCLAISNTQNSVYIGCDDGRIYEINLATFEEAIPLLNASETITSICLNAAENTLAYGTNSGKATIYSLVSNKTINSFTPQTSVITGIKFSLDGNRLLTSSQDNTMRLWNLSSLSNPLCVYAEHGSGRNDIYGIDFSPLGNKMASGGDDNSVHIYPLQILDLVSFVESRVNRNFTQKEWLDYVSKTEKYQKTIIKY